MKSIIKTLFAFVFASAYIFSACSIGLSGEVKKEDRNVKDFTGVELAISGDVYLKQGNTYSLSIEADKDIIDRIETVVEGNTLRIKSQRGYSTGWNDVKINIYVTMPVIEKLSVSGSGDIKATTAIKSENLNLSISGSGDISISDLSVNELLAKISGSGDIDASGSGKGKKVEISVSGSGDVAIKGIQFADANVNVVGSGDAYVEATDNLYARIVGSGDIRYKGKPLVDAKITGSGELKGN